VSTPFARQDIPGSQKHMPLIGTLSVPPALGNEAATGNGDRGASDRFARDQGERNGLIERRR